MKTIYTRWNIVWNRNCGVIRGVSWILVNDAARVAAWNAAWVAAWDSAWDGAWDATRGAARNTIWGAIQNTDMRKE